MQPPLSSLPENSPAEGNSLSSANPAPAAKPGLAPLHCVRVGFFSAAGVALLGLLILIGWKIGSAVMDIFTPFAVAAVLALLLDPLVDKVEARGLSRGMGVCLIFGGLLLIIIVLAMYLAPSLMAQASQLSTDAPSYVDTVRDYVNDFLQRHRKIGTIELPKNFQALSDQFSEKFAETMQGSAGRVAGWLLGSFHFLVELFVALITTFYLLLDIDRIRARALYFTPERWRGTVMKYAGDVGNVFSDYLRGLLIVCALYGLNTILIFYALGFIHPQMRHYALLLGVAAGLLFAVPYVGTISTALVAGIVALVAGGPAFGLLAVGIIVVLNQVYDHIVTPRVIGGGVGLHPVITVFSLVLGGELFGLAGLLLSVPVAASIQVILFSLFPKLGLPTPEQFLNAPGLHAEPEAA